MNVTLQWELPTARTSNRAFGPADVQHVMIDVSADDGANWSQVGLFPPEVLSTQVTDLDFGTWKFRGVVVPKRGAPSEPMYAEVVNEDLSPPNPLVFLRAV